MTSAPAATRSRRRLEPDARREEILGCAVRLFGDRPYAEVSTTDVARAAGVARGLINHYFGTKKGLYLEVVRVLVTVPDVAVEHLPAGTREERVDASVAWFLDVVSRHSRAWLAAVNAEGLGRDPDVVAILDAADEVTADHVLAVVGVTGAADGRGPSGADREQLRSMVRAYAGMCKAAAHEWLVRRAMTREQVHTLLSRTLLTIVEDVAGPGGLGPAGSAGGPGGR
ncbi:MAG: TetR/AcrR family transcriptional regulator [Kineosporiaceae bacterium]